MPMLVRTPEEIFRAEKKDIYVLVDQEQSEDDLMWSSTNMSEGLQMIQQWLKENMPDAKQELLAPSEYSGVICGGIGNIVRVDFSPEQLKAFCDRWEINDKSVDPRFQCFLSPYQDWYQEHGRFMPTLDQPESTGITVWWYTPLGFIHHQLSAEDALTIGEYPHPANHRDIWAHAMNLWPELTNLDTDYLCYGTIRKNVGSVAWTVIYTPPLWADSPQAIQPTAAQIREWFHLPDDAEVIEDSF